ncbi:heavy metal sensor histidine kinase [Shewanella salipaludis]|uniref:Sensor protein n=1 Tax=Shewanella salipaludis TaxID=2723052 RepID=A0A972JL31_9GAMM|nr:heavy metal sensor histidine kinase [Shewanella salipaludis]NMH65002.1 heavy metal sensor histidine kinase [Shewanella salipaludis]
MLSLKLPPGRSRLSLAGRVMLLVGLTLALSFLLLGTVIDHLMRQHFARQDASELAVVAESVRSILAQQPPEAELARLQAALQRAVVGHHGVYFALYSRTDQLLYLAQGPDLGPLLHTRVQSRLDPELLQPWQAQGHSYRGIALSSTLSDGQEVKLLLAGKMDFHLQFIAKFRQTLWLIMACAWLLTMISAWLAITWGHRPLLLLSRQIRSISADRLDIRLQPERVPAELKELVVAFNAMITQVESGFRRLTHFSADIAHELRTPLTNLATQAQVALSQSRSNDEYREILYSGLEEYERLTKMVGDMLWLAKTDNGLIVPNLTRLTLQTEILALFDYFEPWAEEAGVRLTLAGQASLQGDRDMLRRALSNLLANAIKYSQAHTKISVTLEQGPALVGIRITNQGAPLTQAQLARLFDRFYRADPARPGSGDSSGLGLAIVKSIIEVHKGSISVDSHLGLTSFSLSLPRG